MMMSYDIDALVMQSYRAFQSGSLKSGEAAQQCAYRYLAHQYHQDDDRQRLAYQVLHACMDELKASIRPPVYWLEAVGDGYKATVGSDTPISGFCNGDGIYLHKDLYGQELVEVVAHEAYHKARRHDQGGYSAAGEREAIEYGQRVAATWHAPGMSVFVPDGE